MRWRCCFAECLAMCAWGACLNTVLRCSADACLLVPIFADHVGGLHVAMRFEWCVQAFPSGHVGPLATAGNKRWELREGTAKGGGRWHGRSSSQEVEVCVVHVMCYTCVGAPLQASRVSLSHAHGNRASQEHIRNSMHACPPLPVNSFGRVRALAARRWRGCAHTPLRMHLPVIGTIL